MKIPPFRRAHSVLDSIQKGHIVLSVADKVAILLFSSVCVSAGKNTVAHLSLGHNNRVLRNSFSCLRRTAFHRKKIPDFFTASGSP